MRNKRCCIKTKIQVQQQPLKHFLIGQANKRVLHTFNHLFTVVFTFFDIENLLKLTFLNLLVSTKIIEKVKKMNLDKLKTKKIIKILGSLCLMVNTFYTPLNLMSNYVIYLVK